MKKQQPFIHLAYFRAPAQFVIKCDYRGLRELARRHHLHICRIVNVYQDDEHYVPMTTVELDRAWEELQRLDLDSGHTQRAINRIWQGHYMLSTPGGPGGSQRDRNVLAGTIHCWPHWSPNRLEFEISLHWNQSLNAQLPEPAQRLVQSLAA